MNNQQQHCCLLLIVYSRGLSFAIDCHLLLNVVIYYLLLTVVVLLLVVVVVVCFSLFPRLVAIALFETINIALSKTKPTPFATNNLALNRTTVIQLIMKAIY